ncbi:hypothetical protein B0H34DRAFT_684284 [Crassisporium funariophilum]|nr:hypothetical protein B0H34DRAFT_684284 [Crassisporium funariophilum]
MDEQDTKSAAQEKQPENSASSSSSKIAEDPSSSSSPPHISIDVKEDEPPPFAPYDAEFFESSDGDIISHDHHLNEDGEALYRFLLTQSAQIPRYLVSLKGTHTEQRTRRVTRTVNGRTETRDEHYTVTVTDFSFHIDLANYILPRPVEWSSPDAEPTYRGLMVRQVQEPKGRRKATKDEISAFKSDELGRLQQGLPPWHAADGTIRAEKQASSLTLREWADEYAASPKILKEFMYEKSVYGWDTDKLKEAIEGAITQAGYKGGIHVTFTLSRTKICIRPDNKLSRVLSSGFYRVLLIIFLIYPFIWLFKRYSSRGGGRWEVYGGAYALKQSEPLEVQDRARVDVYAGPPIMGPRVIETDQGLLMRVEGYREGEWFREWEPIIKRGAALRFQRSEPLKHVAEGPVDPANALEGDAEMPVLEGY